MSLLLALLLYLQCLVFSKLFITTTIAVLAPVSCYYMTPFNYGGNKTRDAGLIGTSKGYYF